jgi:hypothetical protein
VKLICKGESKSIKEVTKMDSVKELLKNPRVKLSIQEDRSKININGVSIDLSPVNKTETIPFQKRLFNMVSSQNEEIKNLFKNIFGEIN